MSQSTNQSVGQSTPTRQIYLTNSFTPAMLMSMQSTVQFDEISKEEFCNAVSNDINANAINAIGHESTVSLINSICNTNLKVNRIAIKAKPGDQIYIFTVMVRLEEGKILSTQEIQQMYNEGKIKFVRARVYSNDLYNTIEELAKFYGDVHDIIEQLVECAQTGACDERQYDYIANLAKSKLEERGD